MNELSQPPTMVVERQEEEPHKPKDEQLVEEDLLVEEVSIDGMCGVY